jgi:acyl carrier protein
MDKAGIMENSRKEIVRSVFMGLLKREDLRDIEEMPIADLGIDSLDFFEAIVLLEDEHGIVIPVEKLDNDLTMKHLLSFLDE